MIHTQNEGIYRALIAQLDKLARHNRQESYKTRQRYYEAMQRFCRFLAEEYRLQKLTNISGKHLVDYVRHLQENGKAAKVALRLSFCSLMMALSMGIPWLSQPGI